MNTDAARPAVLATFVPLYATALRHAPLHAVAGVAATLVSLLALLLAIWLPWKLLAILGATQAPTLLPPWLLTWPLKHQVLALAAGIVLAYALHLGAEKAIEIVGRRGADRIVRNSNKTGLFNNQGQTAENAYRQLLRTLGDAVFLLVVALLLAELSPMILPILGAWILLGGWLAFGVFARRVDARHWMRGNASWLASVWVFGGFLCVLALTVWQYWHGIMPPLFVSLLAVILARQALQQTARAAQNLATVYRQRRAVHALLLPDTVWYGPEPERGPFDELQETAAIDRWLPEVLHPWRPAQAVRFDTVVRTIESRQIAVVFVRALDAVGEPCDGYLVKLFKHSRDAVAKLEADLLSRDGAALPSLPWLGADKVDKFACHILHWPPAATRLASADESQALQDIRTQLMAHEPSPDLVALYRRSKPFFWQRLDDNTFERLRAAAEPNQLADIDTLRVAWPQWRERLAAMPLQVTLHGLSASIVFQYPDPADAGTPRFGIYDWSAWRLEPVGAAWPISAKMADGLARALTAAAERRGWAQTISPTDAEMAARLYEFERRHALHNIQGALNMLPNLLKVHAAAEAAAAA